MELRNVDGVVMQTRQDLLWRKSSRHKVIRLVVPDASRKDERVTQFETVLPRGDRARHLSNSGNVSH